MDTENEVFSGSADLDPSQSAREISVAPPRQFGRTVRPKDEEPGQGIEKKQLNAGDRMNVEFAQDLFDKDVSMVDDR